MAKSKKIDKDMGFRLKKARLDQKLTYDELSEKSGVSSRYIKEIENHGNVPSLEKLGQLIRALHISADPFFYPAALNDNLDYQRLLVYLSECTDDQIATILALVEAYLRTYKQNSRKISIFSGLFLNYSEEKQGGQLVCKPSTPFELFFSMHKQFFYFISFFQNSQAFKYLYRIYHSLIIRSLFFLKMSMIHNIHKFFQKLPLFS